LDAVPAHPRAILASLGYIPSTPGSGQPGELLRVACLDAAGIVRAVRTYMTTTADTRHERECARSNSRLTG